MSPSNPIRLVIVEDHELVRIGLRSLLDKIDAIEVVAEATSELVVARNVQEWNPDVVLMDIYLPA